MTSIEQESICQMFDRIAPSYDRVNRILSFYQDVRWRKKLARMLPQKKEIQVLDVATGTADLLLDMCKARNNITYALGVDLANKMLCFGKEKVNASLYKNKIELRKGDASALPCKNDQFDIVTIGFGIRNVINVNKALSEMKRVLKPGGTALILEFSMPTNKFIRAIYLLYFRYILPYVGGLLSKEKNAYRYLNRTVETFPYSYAFTSLLKDAGFNEISKTSLTFGVATIYCARAF